MDNLEELRSKLSRYGDPETQKLMLDLAKDIEKRIAEVLSKLQDDQRT